MDVRGDETRRDKIIRLLDLRIPDGSVRLSRHEVSPEIHDVEDIHQSRARGSSPRPRAKVPGDEGNQAVRNRLVEVDPMGQGDVKVDFLRVTGQSGRSAWLSPHPFGPIRSEGLTEKIGECLRRKRIGTHVADGLSLLDGRRHGLATVLLGFRKRESCGSWAKLTEGMPSTANGGKAVTALFTNVLRFLCSFFGGFLKKNLRFPAYVF